MPSYVIVDTPNVSLVNSDPVPIKISVFPANSPYTNYTITKSDEQGIIEHDGFPASGTGAEFTLNIRKSALATAGTASITVTNSDLTAAPVIIRVISFVPVDTETVQLKNGSDENALLNSSSTISLLTPVAGQDAQTVNLNLVFNDATNDFVYWGSSNPLVASVDNTGLVTAVSNGTTTIRAYTQDGGSLSNKIVKSCSVRVGSAYTKVEKLDFTCATGLVYTLYPLGQAPSPAQSTNAQVATPIPVSVVFQNVGGQVVSTPTYPTVYFASSDHNVAKVQLNSNSLPEVIPVGYGKVTITAFSADGAKTDTLAFEFKPAVKPVPVVLVFKPAAPVTGSGSTALPTLTMDSGSTTSVPITEGSLATSDFFYSYDSNGNVTVNSSGLITANAPGTGYVFINSEDGTKSATLRVIVTSPLSVLLLNQTSEIRLQTGSSYQLSVTRIPSTATGGTISWASSTPAYVAVSSSGMASALATGPSRITATCGQIISSDVLIRSLGKVILFDPYDISPQGYVSVVDGVNTLTMLPGVKYNITTLTDPTCGDVEWTEVDTTTGVAVTSGLDIVQAGKLAVVSLKTGQTGPKKLKAASKNAIYFGSAFDTLNIVTPSPIVAFDSATFSIDVTNIKSDESPFTAPLDATSSLEVNIGKAYYIPISFGSTQPSNYTVTWSATASEGIPALTVTSNNGVYPSCNILVPAGTYTGASWTLTATASDGTLKTLVINQRSAQ